MRLLRVVEAIRRPRVHVSSYDHVNNSRQVNSVLVVVAERGSSLVSLPTDLSYTHNRQCHMIYQPPAVERPLIKYSVVSVCVCLCV